MKLYFMFCVAVISLSFAHGSGFAPDERAPERFSQLIATADYVTTQVFERNQKEPRVRTVTVRERSWIEQFSKTMAAAIYQAQEHIWAHSTPVIFYDRQGKRLLTLEVLPGEILRLNSDDYRVGAQTRAAIVALIEKGTTPTESVTNRSGR